MASLNKVMLIGNLTRDPELRHTPRGAAVTDISIAINRVWRDDNGQKQEETTFVDVTAWGRTAETIHQYLHKGSPIYLEGRLHLETWDDKANGQKRSKMKVIAEAVQFLGSPRSSSPRDTPPTPNQTPRHGDDNEEDDIPF